MKKKKWNNTLWNGTTYTSRITITNNLKFAPPIKIKTSLKVTDLLSSTRSKLCYMAYSISILISH